MPAVSRRQQRYLYARFGERWVRRHHFDRLAHAFSGAGRARRRHR